MKENDSTSIQDLMRKHAAALVLYARQFFRHGDFHAGEEVVQDVFCRLLQEKTLPVNPVAWLYKATRNRAISAQRSRTRRANRENDRSIPSYFQVDPNALVDAEEVAAALLQLDRQQREIVTLHLWSEMPFGDIAALIGKPKTTVFRRYEEALETLRTLLESRRIEP